MCIKFDNQYSLLSHMQPETSKCHITPPANDIANVQ